ncbi:MAG TPA: hypothetical protein VMJ10_21245 [Kofleriaceae bacterium]|nr:hypothetical protein [Kofleriaceae bacterium]
MIQRFCFVKLRDEAAAGRAELAEKLRAELVAAGADAVVGLPADASAARWDLSITITCASLDAWHALSQQPEMDGVFDDLAEIAEVVKAWTFTA